MSARAPVTEAMMTALGVIYRRCGDTYGNNPVTNTMARRLAQLGWVDYRVAKVFASAEAMYAQNITAKIVRVRVTQAGRAALAVVSA